MRILLSAGRLFVAHWPALLTLGLLGVAVRNGAMWGAVELSDWNSFVAQLLLIVSPLGYLLPVVGMLWVCRGSLPVLRPDPAPARGGVPGLLPGSGAPMMPSEKRERRLVDVALSVLVPFLVVYEVEGLMDADRARFLNEAAADELFNDTFTTQGVDFTARLGVWSGWTLCAIVAVAFLLRWLLGRLEGRVGFLGIAVLGAVLEIYWTGQVAGQIETVQQRLWGVAEDRQLVAAATGSIGSAREALGETANETASVAADNAVTVLESLDVVLVAPLAWLAIGAVVLGHRLMEPPSTEHRWLDRMTWIPSGLRSLLESLTEDLRARLSALWDGLKMIVHGGLGPMLVFCLGYLVVMRAPYAVGWLVRAVTGPVDSDTWLAFSPMEAAAGLAISLALAAALVAATVARLVEHGLAVRAEEAEERAAGPVTAAAGRS
ncbi:hypothetical protein ACFQHV_10530 [Promicromonospora thailandica]|uniref:Uncharacterized protein n=1 Tax=Promicromonospora thailandica TaxID=765201 RepID=A0A9X2G9A0_9MICO|nr:hypothetical protein [Promicromonospora thailandica]MCP2264911.1 hypothetical protein [Promicromonospora thailandica]BFF18818.1 hypothetical protein GCM10025730_23390 [Promicromonospora thailandica]